MSKARTITEVAVDHFLSHLDSLLLALSQRTMSEKQLDRYAQLLQRGELDALATLYDLACRGWDGCRCSVIGVVE